MIHARKSPEVFSCFDHNLIAFSSFKEILGVFEKGRNKKS